MRVSYGPIIRHDSSKRFPLIRAIRKKYWLAEYSLTLFSLPGRLENGLALFSAALWNTTMLLGQLKINITLRYYSARNNLKNLYYTEPYAKEINSIQMIPLFVSSFTIENKVLA